jgi:predicted RNase H-like nuclease (RuvC/YqgF family)
MGNLADHRRIRKEQGLHEDDPGTGEYTKQEADYIPFLGNNPSEEKPAIYTGRFNVSKSTIELEAKRSGGKLYLTCMADEKVNRAIFECVERFVTAIFDGSAREIKEVDVEDSQIEKLHKELSQVEEERDGLVETLQNLKKIME